MGRAGKHGNKLGLCSGAGVTVNSVLNKLYFAVWYIEKIIIVDVFTRVDINSNDKIFSPVIDRIRQNIVCF